MSSITMKALLETGVHFGHRTRKWNPKMKPYIFTERNGIHILDLHQTLKAIRETYDLVRDTVAGGGSLLFVGTKRQAQDTIAKEAIRCSMPFVSERWLGGTLTNWRTIRQRIDYLKELEARRERGEFELITKKEALILTRQIDKLNERLGGIREMKGLPGLIFVVDVRREYTAIREASSLKIPVMAMVDTNSDPDMIDYVIPANDDAIRAIKLVASVMADAALEGIGLRKDKEIDEQAAKEMPEGYDYKPGEEVPEGSDEDFLGEATLAKLKSGTLEFEEERIAPPKPAKGATAEVEAEAEVDAVAEVEPPAETEAEAEVETQAEVEPEAEVEAEAEIQAEAVPEPEAEMEPEVADETGDGAAGA
jgi:small subunit ribosomal protein S2